MHCKRDNHVTIERMVLDTFVSQTIGRVGVDEGIGEQAQSAGPDGTEDDTTPEVGFLLPGSVAPLADTVGAVLDDPGGNRTGPDAVVAELLALAPPGWQRLEAAFAITVAREAAEVTFWDGQRSALGGVPESALAMVRAHRAAETDAPWWRMLVRAEESGAVEVDYDYGEAPFPEEQLFDPDAYRADLAAYPRNNLPLWLAAYIWHNDCQRRTPALAAASAAADRAAEIWPVSVEDELPSFPAMWARWATLAATFVAVGSDVGPRVLPALGWFESSERSGCTLRWLPGDRAVLSGGVWGAPELDAAYRGDGPLPNLFSGAPDWVAEPVLNPRATTGLLSFCYWWDTGTWYCGESPAAEDCANAIPGVWTADSVVAIVTELLDGDPGSEEYSAIEHLVAAAHLGIVTPETVGNAFAWVDASDLDGAFYQFALAGLTVNVVEDMPSARAVDRVREHIIAHDLDVDDYPLGDLVADRFSCGWMVYVPMLDGNLIFDRAIFYVTDDGVLEQSTSSVPPGEYVIEVERRFHQRQYSAGDHLRGFTV